jgi:response regulator of citrate/malate metabolism
MKLLMIDDLKKIEEFISIDKQKMFSKIKIARTFKEGLKSLDEEEWDLLLLDHDLGGVKDGMDILDYLEIQLINNPKKIPKKIEIITRNPAEKRKMELLAQKLTDPKYVSLFQNKFKN